MPRSFIRRVWKAVKPPPPLPARRRLNRAQRRLIRGTSITLALGASTWAVYAYIASAPDRANSHYRQGMRLLGPGDFQGAAAQFTKAIDIVPEYADAYLGRGKARQAAGQSEAALADFEKAIAIDPTLELAYTLRGTLERSQGDTQKALADFTRSIHLHPTADAYYQRGLTYQTLVRRNAPWTITTWPSRTIRVRPISIGLGRRPGATWVTRPGRARIRRKPSSVEKTQ